MKTRTLFAWILVVCTIGLSGCRSTGPKFDPYSSVSLTNLTAVASSTLDAKLLQTPTNLFTLGPGDRLEIELIGKDSYRDICLVGPDGKIYCYLLPGLDVWGLTLSQTKKLLEKELAVYLKESPQLAVTLRQVESKRVWMLGRFNAPGLYPLTTPTTLLEAFSKAGGPMTGGGVGSDSEEIADLRHSFVMRQGAIIPVDVQRLVRDGDMSQNIYLNPDDFVYLPSSIAREIYVLGHVMQPKSVPFSENLTLLSAITIAGGPDPMAFLSQVTIIRGSLSRPQVAIVNFKDILVGKAPNFRLEPHDIVYVPLSPYRVLERYVDQILSSFVRTVAVNQGVALVNPDSGPIQPTVPLQ